MADVRRGAEALPQVPLVEMSAESVATDISRQGTAIGNTQVAQNRSLPPAEWTGQAADAASAEIQSLGDKTVTFKKNGMLQSQNIMTLRRHQPLPQEHMVAVQFLIPTAILLWPGRFCPVSKWAFWSGTKSALMI